MIRAAALIALGLVLHFVSLEAQNPGSEPDTVQVHRATALKAAAFTSAYYAGSLLVLGRTWYRDRAVVPFHYYDDSNGYLQVDKLGHAFGAYAYSYAGYHYLLKTGFTPREAVLFGGTLGFTLQVPIEIMDGIHEGYGFSWTDMAANALGSAVVISQALLFQEQVAKYKFSYAPSRYADNAGGALGTSSLDRLLKDYNGHTYWLSVPLHRLVRDHAVPEWLNVAAGYGADGMYGEFSNEPPHHDVVRYRQLLLSVDVDWSRIKTDHELLGRVLKGLTFVKLPAPALEYASTGRWKAYWLYY